MSGAKQNSQQLNEALLRVVRVLRDNIDDNDWFIGYGTLLGIIRDGECINHDDDVDILVNNNNDNYHLLKEKLSECGFTFTYEYGIDDTTQILKTIHTDECGSVDFYMCDVDDEGNFYDSWEKTHWLRCRENESIPTRHWRGVELNIPSNYINKLTHRYGEWRVVKQEEEFKRAGTTPLRLP